MNTQYNFYKRVKTSGSPSHYTNALSTKSGIMPKIVTNYNIQNLVITDVERLKEETIKLKNELNKRNKDYNGIKIAFLKLDSENKKNMRIIEDILEEATRQKYQANNELETDLKNLIHTNISTNSLNRLKESNIINNLRRQNLELKNQVNQKEEEFINLKSSSKASKYHELDQKMKNSIDELNFITESFNTVKTALNDKEAKLKETTEERDYYKAMNVRVKSQHDDTKEKMNYYQDQYNKLLELNKKLEEKLTNFKFKENAFRTQMKDKENEINGLKEELSYSENFKEEKEKLEKTNQSLNKTVNSLKDENEKKTRRLKDLEKLNLELKEKNEKINSEIKKLNEAIKEKNSKSKKIEEEITKLREDNKKLKSGIVMIKNKTKEFVNETENTVMIQEENPNINNTEEVIEQSEKKIETLDIEKYENENNRYDDNFENEKDEKIENFNESKIDTNNINNIDESPTHEPEIIQNQEYIEKHESPRDTNTNINQPEEEPEYKFDDQLNE